MRLLQVNLRGLILYSLILLLISIPVSLLSVQAILNKEVDQSILIQANQFIRHVKGFEYLDDLERDLQVLDKLSYNIHIKPSRAKIDENQFHTIATYDSLEKRMKPLRQLVSGVTIQGRTYELTVQRSLIDNQQLVLAIGLVQITVSILLTVGLLLLHRKLSKRIWRPFYKTLDSLKAFELDKNETISLEESDISEFNDLNTAISHLTERNRKIFLNQKEFIENASHELQTPIAIFQSKLDTLMQSPNLTHADADTIMELESTAQRMSRLNKNLLLLSKIDNDQFLTRELIDLTGIIQCQIEALTPMAQPLQIKFITSLAPISITANRTLIEILLTNLFHNAIRHSPKREAVIVSIDAGKIYVSNKGKASAMDIEKMTERFSKESADPDSTGLGLAIVKKICESCSYKIQYFFKDSTHTFVITF